MKDPVLSLSKGRVAPERCGPSRKRRPSPSSGSATTTPAQSAVRNQSLVIEGSSPRSGRTRTAPLHGAPPTGGVAASRAMTRLSRHRRSAASRSACASAARTTRREARVPAGQDKKAAPSRARSAGQSASAKNPAPLPSLPIVTRRAKTTGLVRIANRAGCPKGSGKRHSEHLVFESA